MRVLRLIGRRVGWHLPTVSGLLCLIMLVGAIFLTLAPAANAWGASHPFGANIVSSSVFALIFGSGGYFILFGRKGRRAVSRYTTHVRTDPSGLAELKSSGHKPLVPIDPTLCEDIVAELTLSSRDLPVLIVGPGGVGKSTILSGLLPMLMKADRLPVPLSVIGLNTIDLLGLASSKFLTTVDQEVKSADEGDAIWRRLRRMRRMVVVVDGLDQFGPALLPTDRDAAVAGAVSDARTAGLGVVALTRPDAVPAQLEASVVEVGALTHDQAVTYIETRLESKVAEGPLDLLLHLPIACRIPFYLNIVAELAEAELLAQAEMAGAQSAQVRLLDVYLTEVIAKRIQPSLVSSARREDCLEVLSVVAAGMLIQCRLERAIIDVVEDYVGTTNAQGTGSRLRDAIEVGAALGILDSGGGRIFRFRHSILHSYMASRAFRTDNSLWRRVVEANVSTESLAAVVMWASWAFPRSSEESPAVVRTDQAVSSLPNDLMQMALGREDPDEALAVAIAAADVANFAGWVAVEHRVSRVALQLRERTRRNGKLAVIQRLRDMKSDDAVQTLWAYARDSDFLVRWDAAKGLISGGCRAHDVLLEEFERPIALAEKHNHGGLPFERSLDLAVLGWILPGMSGGDCPSEHRAHLERVLLLAQTKVDPLYLEVSLARGFKLAATVRPHVPIDGRAVELLQVPAVFWHSRILLLQAAALRAYTDSAAANTVKAIAREFSQDPHPFVREAARIILAGIERKQPLNRFVWESEVVETAAPSRGYSPEASRLLGEISLYSDLVYRARATLPFETEMWFDYRSWYRSADLPVCMSHSRGREELFKGCVSGCAFHFCDLANPKSSGPIFDPTDRARSEVSEAFCRLQVNSLQKSGRAPWQPRLSARAMMSFWERVGDRAPRE